MSEQEEFISKEDLSAIRQIKSQAEYARLLAENFANKNKIVELTYENSVLKIYLKYNLNSDGKIDELTGRIIREPKKEEENDRCNEIEL